MTIADGLLMIAGVCGASTAQLADAASATSDEVASMWPGAYLVIRVRPGRVQLRTDPMHAAPVYTARARGATVWASAARPLADLTDAAVDDAWLAAHLLSATTPTPGRSPFHGVRLLDPGCRWDATGTNSGGTISHKTVWVQPDHREPDPRTLREALRRAVACRTGATRLAADLSGGLDSSTLAALAADVTPVAGLTLHPAGSTTGGDLDYARAVAAAYPTIEHLLQPLGPDDAPFAHLDALPASDEPAPSTIGWAGLAAELHTLTAAGVTRLLTGDGGDTLFLPPPTHLTTLTSPHRLPRMVVEAQRWARLHHQSPWPLLYQALTGNTPALAGIDSIPGWATPAALDAARPLWTVAPRSPDDVLLAEIRWVARTGRADAQLTAAAGIDLHNPYTDPTVAATVLATRPDRRGSPTRYKPLLADATRGLLPNQVRLRTTKGQFAGDYHAGLRRHQAIADDLAHGHLAHAGLLNPTWLTRQLDAAAAGAPVVWPHLLPPLAAEAWLRTLATRDHTSWTWHTQAGRNA